MTDFPLPHMDGALHPAYANPRPEVTAMIPANAKRVLDVGCSVGIMGESLRSRGHHVTGIELHPELAAEARARLDDVVEADVEALAREGRVFENPFDCVCFADVLEHLRNPWAVVRWSEGLLSETGVVVASVPNIARLETLWKVFVKREWPYLSLGVFDRTHLRWFARKNLTQLFEGTSLEITEMRRVFMLSLNHSLRRNKLARFLGDMGTLQFVIRAERR